jgi:hypothetical protein
MERANGASGSSSQHEPEQASKHADQIPDLNEHLLIPLHLLDHPRWHISVPFLDCTNCMQYLAIVLLYLPVGSVGYPLHSSFIIGHP